MRAYIQCDHNSICNIIKIRFNTGSTYLDEHNDTALAVFHWKEAHEIRSKDSGYIGMVLQVKNGNEIFY